MTKTEARTVIRKAAAQRDCRYRVTRDGEVHFHGTMPNSNQDGWYFVAWSAEEAATRIQGGTL